MKYCRKYILVPKWLFIQDEELIRYSNTSLKTFGYKCRKTVIKSNSSIGSYEKLNQIEFRLQVYINKLKVYEFLFRVSTF